MAYLPCDKCDSTNAVEPYEDGDKCFSCGWKDSSCRKTLITEKKQKNPKKIQLAPLTDYWINWIKKRGINARTIKEFNLQYDELSESIVYPLKIKEETIGYQLRDKNKTIKTVRYEKEDETFLFTANAGNNEFVVVVEDPVSAMRVWQDAKINAVALLGTNLTTANKLFLLNNYNNVIVWMDGDIAGYRAACKVIKDCTVFCPTKLVFTHQDPKDMPAAKIKDIVDFCIEQLNYNEFQGITDE